MADNAYGTVVLADFCIASQAGISTSLVRWFSPSRLFFLSLGFDTRS